MTKVFDVDTMIQWLQQLSEEGHGKAELHIYVPEGHYNCTSFLALPADYNGWDLTEALNWEDHPYDLTIVSMHSEMSD